MTRELNAPWCTCETPPGRQSGYTRINEQGDFGCARCRKMSKLAYEVRQRKESKSD